MNFIVAVDENYGIGYKGKLLVHLPEDLKYFKEMTFGKAVVMGRTTLVSLPGGVPLLGRTTIVLTRDHDFYMDGVIICNNLEELFKALSNFKDEDVFVAGGETIYHQLLPFCSTGYITHIQASFLADKRLSPVHKMPEWELVWRSENKTYKDTSFYFARYQNKDVKERIV